MRAVRYDLVIEKGAKLSRIFRYLDSELEPIDLSDHVARFTIRAPGVDGTMVLDEQSDASSTSWLDIDGPLGEISVDLSALLTVEELEDGCRGWYTLKVWPAGEPENAIRLAEGSVRWVPEATVDDEV